MMMARTYKLNKDPTASLEKRMISSLFELRKAGQLHPDVYTSCDAYQVVYHNCRGLHKVHKLGVLLRCIVPFVSSPMYELSKFLAGLLAPLVG